MKQKSAGKKTKQNPCKFSARTALSLYVHVKSVSLFPNSKDHHLVWVWFRSPSSSGPCPLCAALLLNWKLSVFPKENYGHLTGMSHLWQLDERGFSHCTQLWGLKNPQPLFCSTWGWNHVPSIRKKKMKKDPQHSQQFINQLTSGEKDSTLPASHMPETFSDHRDIKDILHNIFFSFCFSL